MGSKASKGSLPVFVLMTSPLTVLVRKLWLLPMDTMAIVCPSCTLSPLCTSMERTIPLLGNVMSVVPCTGKTTPE